MKQPQDSQSKPVWIDARDPLPDVCCCCGMFTDHRTKINHTGLMQKSGPPPQGCSMVVFMLLINVLLGPLGWLLSFLIHRSDDEQTTHTVKEKTSLKISQCRLCAGMGTPEIMQASSSPKRLLVYVHPQFKKRLDEARQSATGSHTR